MNTTRSPRHPPAAARVALTVLILVATGAAGLTTGVSAAANSGGAPIVTTDSGAVQGMAGPGGYAFLGLPYAAPPTGNLRWRPPQPSAAWTGIRDATQFAPSCPQQPSLFQPPGPMSEDCLYLNVYTPQLGSRGGGEGDDDGGRPVLVWIHGGGLTQDGGRNYEPTRLAADGIVAVTINYRLGALGFLAHPALASRPGGPAGNYGLMDQQAALRWVQRNIAQFGGNPHNVTIAGQSAGGLSVLAQLISPRARGLFQRAIVESGTFALTQVSLADAEAFGEGFAAEKIVGCADQTAACLRSLPVSTLVDNFPPAAIPGVVDGQVLPESIGAALAAGRFTHVPILNGTNHDEERLFVADLHLAVSGGMFVGVPNDTYQKQIAAVLGVSDTRAAAIAAEYPLSAYPSQTIALSTLVADANFACTALQVDRWAARQVPTFAYEFNDDLAPPRYAPTDPPVATHESELPYLFDLPNAPIQAPFSPDQETLAARMRAAWASFDASGDPSTAAVPWPSFNDGGAQVMSLVPPQPQVETDFATNHHCAFWAAG